LVSCTLPEAYPEVSCKNNLEELNRHVEKTPPLRKKERDQGEQVQVLK
jgi:hypothetical protein